MAKTVRKIRYQPLEPRILLDAAAGVTFADSTADPEHQDDLQNQIALLREQKALEQKALEHKVADPRSEIRNNLPGAVPGAAIDSSEIPATGNFRLEDLGAPAALPTDLETSALVVVDTGVEGYEDLLTGLEPGTEILLIDADENGLQKLADHVAGRDDITSIHILSHGGQGEFSLGSVTLNSDNIDQHAELLSQIGAALTEQGDLLLYGCNVADGGDSDNGKRSGVEFVARIADVTGADVAASTDLTGAAGQGGDWNLEYTIGQIDGANLALTSFDGLLNDAPTATDDTGTTDEDISLTVANDATGTNGNNADLLLNDTDPNGDTLTISEVAGNTANLGKATDGTNGGSFAIEANGAYTFDPGTDFNGLKSGETATTSVTYTVSDGSLTDTATLTVTINGADDVPTLGLSAGTVTEDAVDSGGKNLVATGRVPITGGDTGDDKLTAATLTGSYGNLKVVADGTWTYTADNSQVDIQQLPANTTLSESFIVTSADTVTTGSVVIRINGADDAAIVTGTMTATLTEDMADAAGNLVTQTFTVTFSGGDLNEPYGFEQSTGATNAPSGAVLNLSGLTTPANTATWSFNVANDDPAVQAIGPGESLVLRYTVILADSITRLPFTVTIIGADDVPTLTSASATLTEDTAITDGNLVASGTVTATGGDASDRRFIAGSQTGTYGELTLAANGAWTYTAANNDPDIQGLKATDSPTDTFIVTSADKVTTTSVTITINGKNDAPVATDDTGITDQDTAITATAAATGANPGLLLNDTDPDGETLTIAEVDGATRQPRQSHRRQQRRRVHHQRQRRLELQPRRRL